MTGKWRLTGVVLTGLVLTGCSGYSSERPFRQNLQTVHVEMIQSREFRRELEFALTEALTKRINMDSPYRIADKEHADTVFSGEILEVRQNTLGNQFPTNLPRETAATIVMRYRWKDQRTGKILVERPQFVGMVSYVPPGGESFFQGVDVRGMDRLAERIVESMETTW